MTEEKSFLKRSDLKTIDVPLYDELSVKQLLPKVESNSNLMKFMPDKLPKGKTINREYFFNVMNSLYPDLVKKMIAHAHKLRFESGQEDNRAEEVMVSDKMWGELNSMPFSSCKSTLQNNQIFTFRAQGEDPASDKKVGKTSGIREKAQAIRSLSTG